MDWLLLINTMLGSFLAGLSARIFMISLPSLASGLGSDILGIAWALISFQIAGVGFSIVFGRLGDIYGREKIYNAGFIILTAGAFFCGVSQDALQLIIARFVQGVGAAMTQSAGRALAMDAMPAGSEGKAQGIMTMAFHSGFFVGPPLGGLIIDYIHWRGVFFFIVFFGLAGVALSVVRSRRGSKPVMSPSRRQVDYLGAGLLIALTVLLTLLLDHKAAQAWGLGRRGFLTLAFAGIAWGFLVHESKAPSPMMNLSLFKIRMFTYSVISLLTLSITRGLVGFLMPFYLQDVLQLTPSFMGILFLAPPIFTITLSTVGGHITDRVGPRIPATIGVLASLAAVVLGAALRVDSHWLLPTAMLGLTGIGTAFFNSSNQAAIIGSVPKEHRGFANGMVHTAFELGHLLGVSVGGLLLTVAYEYYSGIAGVTPSAENPLAFVSSMNASYVAAVGLTLIALCTSLMRGSGKIRAAVAKD
ncbi:MAG: MFS transporter [Deltaproteobacteria bacterium]|nr:MFS transporter [Deltaproteobacteria bacterium]MBI2209548.1 MFS transporter [Deltaproteobacteria bacterium]MBI2347063.1 MFS transporter [Deltaproteobacteria bacterium]MBI2990768.1 MFS transporter [Deltaproteobacteria bacterium]MBI3061586.1 MFS transporter [Deltaproteobacteria bacterium]